MIYYTDLDAAIIATITQGRRRAGGIERDCEKEAKTCLTGPRDCTMRAVDRRLQALRRSGRIKFSAQLGWEIA